MRDGILSIQSAVAFGHVGNSAAVFPLQRLGFEVWPVNTVLFSNHTGYGAWRGRVVDLGWVEEIVAGIDERGAFADCQAVLSGYLGAPQSGEAVLGALARVKAQRPDAIYACDPVMGDEGCGFFVRPGIPEHFRDAALPQADIVTPNQFELSWLAGMAVTGVEDAVRAVEIVRRMGPKIVVGTSIAVGDEGMLGVLGHSEAATWLVRTPRLGVDLSGTGDVFTALLLGNWLRTRDLRSALERSASSMYALVEATRKAGLSELALVAAQDQLVTPSHIFEAERLR